MSGFQRFVRADSFAEAAASTHVKQGRITRFRWITAEDMK